MYKKKYMNNNLNMNNNLKMTGKIVNFYNPAALKNKSLNGILLFLKLILACIIVFIIIGFIAYCTFLIVIDLLLL